MAPVAAACAVRWRLHQSCLLSPVVRKLDRPAAATSPREVACGSTAASTRLDPLDGLPGAGCVDHLAFAGVDIDVTEAAGAPGLSSLNEMTSPEAPSAQVPTSALAAVRAERPTISVAGDDVPCSFAAYRRRRCLRTRLAGMYSTQALCGSSLECPRTCRSNQSGRRARSSWRPCSCRRARPPPHQGMVAGRVIAAWPGGCRPGSSGPRAPLGGRAMHSGSRRLLSPALDSATPLRSQHSKATFGHLAGSVPPGPQAGRGQVLSN